VQFERRDPAAARASALPVVVYCHLRWDFVYQRPQHVLSRIAATHPVIVVEEPLAGDAAAFELSRPAPGVLRAVPRVADAALGFDGVDPARLRERLHEEGVGAHVAWLYTPMALPLATALAPSLVVYDCMDELSLFKDAPPALMEREDRLFALADVVFTGGPSLYAAKKPRHRDVHCMPSSVDVAHFRRGRDGAGEPEEQRALPHPRLGFFGVIDERFDRDLLDAVAAAHPEWQLVIVGPVVKIPPSSLPRRANIHYLGQRGYAELPGCVAGWDVCLLPFALNDATRFISPTKTLEYMAAERPIVSTPVRDVADLYRDVVYVADGPAAFVAACERALVEPQQERFARMRRILDRTSWDATARAMQTAMHAALRRRRAVEGEHECPDRPPSSSALGQPA
jgi:UDP-galactopyranose mutase